MPTARPAGSRLDVAGRLVFERLVSERLAPADQVPKSCAILQLHIQHIIIVRQCPVETQRVARSASFVLFGLAASVAAYDAIPDARITTGVQNRLTISHDRVGVVGQNQTVVLRLHRSADEPVSIRLDDATAKTYAIDRTQPVADTVQTVDGSTVLTFGTGPNSEVFELALTLKPLTWGYQDLKVSASVAQRFTIQAAISQFVAPLWYVAPL